LSDQIVLGLLFINTAQINAVLNVIRRKENSFAVTALNPDKLAILLSIIAW
jgi:hypothetical protein